MQKMRDSLSYSIFKGQRNRNKISRILYSILTLRFVYVILRAESEIEDEIVNEIENDACGPACIDSDAFMSASAPNLDAAAKPN